MSSCHICLLCLMMILIITGCSFGIKTGGSDKFSGIKKLLVHALGTCTNRDISISQSRDTTSGIPQYIVQIVNTCVFGCAPSSIHLHCGWFASARMVNPRTFKRLSYDDCLVNGGKVLKSSQIVRFTYSNSFMYALQFKSAKFC
ncbi:hypothetical protein OIU76_013655 [Salix suchowensis]|nr:hypothetical protein OIU76_013655 [Salix suchowensis]